MPDPTPRILILSGPTREYIDPVRYISNASSGRQGLALAEEALARGYGVEMIQGPVDLDVPDGIQLTSVVTSAEMHEKALARHPFCDILIGAAAVSDFRPREISTMKRKRGHELWSLELEPTTDILRDLARRKGMRVHVGFALETDHARENGLRKLIEKKLDWIVVNSPDAIGAEEGEYEILGAGGSKVHVGRVDKRELAARLLDQAARTLDEVRHGRSEDLES